MSSLRVFRSLLGSVIFVALTAAPAYPWHGSGSISALAIDSKTPTTLYAVTCDRGVFKSTDGGASWNATGLTGVGVLALAIDPQTPTILYAGGTPNDCGSGLFIEEWFQGGVYKSTDGGSTWVGLTGGYVTALAIDPQRPTTLYAGEYWGGVFKSTDGGGTWSPTGAGPFMVNTLAIDPLSPNIIYAADAFVGDEGFTWYGGVFKSTDGGATWTGLASGDFGGLAIDPQTPTTLYACGIWLIDWQTGANGVFESTDGGATWSTSASYPSCSVVNDPQTPSTRYAGTASGVLKSTDGGTTWTAASTGLTNILSAYRVGSRVGPLAIDPLTSNTLYAGTAIGVFKSSDGGASWSPTGLFQHSPLVSLSLSPTAVAGGAASTGTVTLATPAPAAGITVTLSSSTPTVAAVPASVIVLAGATSANFMISTESVTVTTWPQISATFDGVTVEANLTVYATTIFATLSSMYLSPASVSGGTPSTGTVGLSAPAPVGGKAISLSSSNPAVATVPATVTVPAGATWANFTVFTSSVTASTAVTISADNYWAMLTVTPAPAATLSSVSLNPVSVTSGSTSIGTVTLSAAAPAGGAVVTLSSSDATVATVPASVTVPAGATSATFTASTVACTSGSVTISGNYGGATRSAELTVMTAADSITIQGADYFANKRELRVAAKSTSSTATLQVYVTSTGESIGQLTKGGDGTYRGQFTWPVYPQNITVKSSLCGSATKAVTSK